MRRKGYSKRPTGHKKIALDIKSEIINNSLEFIDLSNLNNREINKLRHRVSKIASQNLRRARIRMVIEPETKQVIIKSIINNISKSRETKYLNVQAYIPKPPIRTKPIIITEPDKPVKTPEPPKPVPRMMNIRKTRK